MNETDAVRERYRRRDMAGADNCYDPLKPDVWLRMQEVERALIRWITRCGLEPLEDKRLLEVGCGGGTNLLRFVQLGFRPENLVGNELLEQRAETARHRLPEATRVVIGDAAELSDDVGTFDIVFQSTVFSSILDAAFQRKLADRMWSLVRPGGGVLWYDFVYNNPTNPDVRGVPMGKVSQLFPSKNLIAWKVTLAPPLGRRAARIHPSLYGALNLLPVLRTHSLCWISKE
jgi:SAM-dependent methyltransferase